MVPIHCKQYAASKEGYVSENNVALAEALVDGKRSSQFLERDDAISGCRLRWVSFFSAILAHMGGCSFGSDHQRRIVGLRLKSQLILIALFCVERSQLMLVWPQLFCIVCYIIFSMCRNTF